MLLFGAAQAATAEAPVLQWPLACTAGTDCWIANYVDTDPADGSARDFQCGPRTYDGHKGTDIAIRDWAALGRGVDVLAAAAGKVLRTRDGMPDMEPSDEQRKRLLAANRGCGNGVVVRHAGGWTTMYCHMKQGSIAVKRGQPVRVGQKLGEVGHSGNTEFPHLHFSVSLAGRLIDPFTGSAADAGCGGGAAPLWARDLGLGYQPVSFYAAGFLGHVPDFDALAKDASPPPVVPVDAEAITFWIGIFGVLRGDRIHIEIRDPAGRIVAQEDIVQEKTRARQFYFTGRRNSAGRLAAGTYQGSALLRRPLGEGETVERRIAATVRVE